MEWVGLTQNREIWLAVVIAVMNLQVPLNVGNMLSSLGIVSLSGMTLLHGVS
jgi:hypothetical protein